eukprot:1007219-Prymnesium_polylepis.1
MPLKMTSVSGEEGTQRTQLMGMPSAFSLKAVNALMAKARRSKKHIAVPLVATDDVAKLAECEQFLLYLNAQTWTRGDASANLAVELLQAIDLGVHVRLAHEMPWRGWAGGALWL